MKLKVLWIIAIVFGMNLLTVGSEVGWLMAQTPEQFKGLPNWANNSSSHASVKKYKNGLLFTIPEAGKDYRWKVDFSPISLQQDRWLSFNYQAVGLNNKFGGTTNYILYISTLDATGKKQRIFPITGQQLELSPKLTGVTRKISLDLYKQFRLTGSATITRIVIGMQAQTANAQLYISQMQLASMPNQTKILKKTEKQKSSSRGFNSTLDKYGTIGWQLDVKSAQCKGLPGWVKNPDTNSTVKKIGETLTFVIPEAGKGYRWKLAVDELSLKNYPMLHLRYRGNGVSTAKNGTGNYTIYMSTLGKNKQKLFPVLGEQLKVDGKSHDIIIDLYQQFKLSGQAKILRLIIGMNSATANATLSIEKLVIYSNSAKVGGQAH